VEAEPIAEGEPEEVTATTEPPDPVYEEQTDSPGPGNVWVGGYWGWNGADWSWNWGRWATPPAGKVYIEPYYERVGGKVVYVQGSWGAHDAPRRSYGGEHIKFTAAVRPANYHRGEHVVVEHKAGPPPGKRPGGAYEHATGKVRPLPKATAPAHRVAEAHENATPREKEKAHEGTAGHPTGHEGEHPAATEAHDAQKKPEEKKAGLTEKKPEEKKTEPATKKPEEKKGELVEKKPEEKKPEATEKKPEEKKAGLTEKKPEEKKAEPATKKPEEATKKPEEKKPETTTEKKPEEKKAEPAKGATTAHPAPTAKKDDEKK